MRKDPASAFTLIEMLTVLAIIVILSGLVLSVGGYVQKKSALSRAAGEIAMLGSACESYKSDNGSFPRDTENPNASKTDLINPKVNFIPTDPLYAASSLFLYKELTGDKTGPNGGPDGVPDDGQPRYMKEYEPRILNAKKDAATKAIILVFYLQDPFGFPYAYSTSAAKDEETYQTKVLREPDPAKKKQFPRPTAAQLKGFNSGSYDLWSTGGKTTRTGSDTDASIQAQWVKNW